MKQCLHQLHGLPPRFRQRLLLQGSSLHDADKLDSPLDLEVVVLSLTSASQTEADEIMAAANLGMVEEALGNSDRPIHSEGGGRPSTLNPKP